MERAIEQAYAFFRFFIQFAKVLLYIMSKKKIFVLYIYNRLPQVRVRSYSIHALSLTP